jgi:hypothetical protein
MLASPRTVREIYRSSLLADRGPLIAFPSRPIEKSGVESLILRHVWRPCGSFRLGWTLSSMRVCLRRKSRSAADISLVANRPLAEVRAKIARTRPNWLALYAGLALCVLPETAIAACSPGGPAITSGTTVNCDAAGGTQKGRIGNGPNGSATDGNNVTVNVNTNAMISVTDTNAISLGNHAIITLFSGSTVQTTTDTNGNTGEYGKGDNAIEFNDSSTLTINTGASVIASRPETTEEAINPIGSGNAIINHGQIKAGAGSAIFLRER